ncbi:pyocin knob domain-containing protein [Acinetobacter baumannii]|uniref:pyocin knob domain-containing protein n=1 Tax=Acinetobacter baumannii TaxID=470 RepID=UPI0024499E46|nr:pyocin knob domain-containing protein [Acinetobacter baumannii]MDH2630411.1 pyocin knob domain-containing protein [Acinetobacter baumannii]
MGQNIIIEVPGKKISELDFTSSVSASNTFPVVQDEETLQAPLGQVVDFVKGQLGSAALKNEEDFITPDGLDAVSVASQQRDDAVNERVDNVEFSVLSIKNGNDASFNTYNQMIAYTPSQANVSVRVNNDPDASKNGTYTWDGASYTKGFDIIQFFQNWVNQNPLFKPVTIASGSNLNTFTTSGFFDCRSVAIAESGQNFPQNSAGMLVVMSTGASVYQLYQVTSTGSIFYRASNGTQEFNAAWREIANMGSIANVLQSATTYADNNPLFKRKTYTASQVTAANLDFNNVITDGEYLFIDNAAVQAALNPPVNVWGALQVYRFSSTTSQTVQKFTEGVTGNVWVRYFGVAWSQWLRLANAADINVALEAAKTFTKSELAFVVKTTGGIYTHQLYDVDKNSILGVDIEGGLVLVGLEGTVQEEIVALKNQKISTIKDTSLASIRSRTDTFIPEAQAALNMQAYAQIGGCAPAPINSLYQQRYTINDLWLNSISFSKPSTHTRIDTPYRIDDGVCHPHIIEFYNGFRGYRYLMLLTPYYDTKEQYENPCVYGSNDLIDFELLDGFQQPLADRPISEFGDNHNSDNVFAHDPRTGELIAIWRETWRNWNGEGETADAWVMRKTKDCYNWTEKEYLFGPYKNSTGMYTAAPAFLYDPKKDEWHVYIGIGNAMQHYVKKTLTHDGWELPTTISTPSDFKPWHVDVRYIGNKIVALVHDNTNGQFRFGVSSDFVNFTWATASNYTETGTDMYKASFLPVINNANQLAFDVIWSTRNVSANVADRWKLFINRTNFVDAGIEVI